ncbi:MAG: cytochrome c family protein [Deltaproteobacteria bacterium]|nr:cytochrome c family protein [Deltaproteobacteria bacterium]MBW2646866.1 cytochrome c family protein [Deltaproteobacteria bacterium]
MKIKKWHGILLIFLFSWPAGAQEQETNAYVGSALCRSCHEVQYEVFLSHARKSRSFESIQKMKKGLTDDEIKECYGCHTTAYGEPGGFIDPEQTPELKNAGCEVCHGPGKLHIDTQDPARIIKKVTIDVCQRCHIEDRVSAFRYKPTIYAGSH